MQIPAEIQPYRHLAAAIILTAVADIMAGCGKRGSKQKGRYLSAIRFLKSDWFDQLARGIDLDPEKVRARLLDKEERRRLRPAWDAAATMAREWGSFIRPAAGLWGIKSGSAV